MKGKQKNKSKSKFEEPFPSENTPNPPQVMDPSKPSIENKKDTSGNSKKTPKAPVRK